VTPASLWETVADWAVGNRAQALGCALDGSLVSEGRKDGPRHSNLVGLCLLEFGLPTGTRSIGRRFLMPEAFEPTVTPSMRAAFAGGTAA